MKKQFKSFLSNDSGAITTEFLVLVAAVVGLGVASVSGLGGEDKVVNVEPDRALENFVAGF